MKEDKVCAVCAACEVALKSEDVIVITDLNEVYHKECVELYPISYVVVVNGEPVGESVNDDGEKATNFLNWIQKKSGEEIK